MKIVYRFAVVFLLVMAVQAFSEERHISVQAQADKTTLTIGDRLNYTLTLKYSPDFQIDSLDLKEKIGQFEIKSSTSSTQTKKKQVIQQTHLVLVPWQTGEYEIPAVAINYKDKDGNQKTIFSDPVKVEVKSVLGEVFESTDIRGLKGQLELARSIWFYWAGLVAILIVTALLFYLVKRRPRTPLKPEIVRPAWELAKEELLDLQQSFRSGKIQTKEYYFRLSEILRGYLERRFGIPLLESTTEEIESRLKEDFLSPDSKDSFLRFLQDSDLIKFARVVPESQKPEQDWQLSYRIVQETIPQPVVSQTAEAVQV